MHPPRHLLVLLVALLAGSCSDSSGNKDQGTDRPGGDIYLCKQPPSILDCHRPPNQYSETLWYCEGCGYCGGGYPTKACNGFIGDCREFYDSCIPRSYTRCDANAPDNILGLCGDCFFREAGVIPTHCDKLVDAGLTDVGAPGDG